jgi:predicted dehydrogenase
MAADQAEKPLRFGIIGIGVRCWQHIERINRNRDTCEILAICDVRQDRLEHGLSISEGTPATYTDFRELLEHPGLNVVLVATTHDQHAPMSIAAMEVGCDVMVEKPMATTVAECEAMNAAAEREGRILMVAEQHRYIAVNRKVKALIEAGELGKVICIAAPAFRGPWAETKPWLNTFATSGGGLLSESCHDLDAFHWILGSRAVRVAGFGGTAVFEGQDTLDNIQLVYEFENGVTLSFGFGIFVPGGYRNIAILGSHGRLEYGRQGKEIRQYRYAPEDRDPGEPLVHDLTAEMTEPGHVGTDAMFQELISCVQERRRPLTAGTEMVECVRMCIAGQDAMRQRAVVML